MRHFISQFMAAAVLANIVGCSDSSKTTRLDAIESHASEAERADEALSQSASQNRLAQNRKTIDHRSDLTSDVHSGLSSVHRRNGNRSPASFVSGANSHERTFVVQIGAFRMRENADRLLTKLQSEGFPVEIQSINHAPNQATNSAAMNPSRSGELYLVNLIPTKDPHAAESWQANLKEKEGLEAQIVSKP